MTDRGAASPPSPTTLSRRFPRRNALRARITLGGAPYPNPRPTSPTLSNPQTQTIFMSPAAHSPSRSFGFATAAATTFATPHSTVPIALRRYAKKTGKDLMSHPIAIRIDSCESPDSILRILQEEAQAFSEYRKEDPTLINCLSSVVHGFHALSSTAPFNTGSCTVRLSSFVIFLFYVLQHFSSRKCPPQRQFFQLSLFSSTCASPSHSPVYRSSSLGILLDGQVNDKIL
jgi:hypothetical protein